MKVVAIIQARMGSSRLPGKVLKAVLGKPLLEYQLERVRLSQKVDQIVVATTNQVVDDQIVLLCNRLNIPYYRGSEENVLERYYRAATHYKANIVVRLTSDCPVIDPVVIDSVINHFLVQRDDYVSNTLERTYPRGMDVEVFSMSILDETYHNATTASQREHVTPYIYQNAGIYRLGSVCYHTNQSRHRWTVDTKEDFELIEKIISSLYPINRTFTLEDILHLLKGNPDWEQINSHIEQKKLEE